MRALKVATAEPEPTAEELAIEQEVRSGIEVLFGSARQVTESECSAYLRGPDADYIHDVLINGHWRYGGRVYLDQPGVELDALSAITKSIRAIRNRWPKSVRANSQLVWRVPPEFRRLPPQKKNMKFLVYELPERVHLYMRLTVTPPGV